MKILYLVHQFFPDYYRGTEKFVFNMASMMKRKGHHVTVLTYSKSDPFYYKKQKDKISFTETTYKGIPVIAFTIDKISKKQSMDLTNEKLKEFARKILEYVKPDLIHIGHPMRVTEFIKAAMTLKIPYLNQFHNYEPLWL